MEYNSKRESLIIPEYGRHVQKMILYIKTIEDKEKRQALVEGTIALMLRISPGERKTTEYTNKMWTHLLKIADYELDIDVPEGVSLTRPEVEDEVVIKTKYPNSVKKYRHYGQYIQDLIEKALAMEDGPKKDEFVRIIGSYMKTAYKQWNRDHYINDESVLEDIRIMTNGELKASEDVSFDYLKNSTSRTDKRKKATKSSFSQKKKPKYKQYKKRKPSY